ncbi:tetratricopeptide repeat protein [Falsiroseomonas bella]|nr:tetratricopeptide repeat protein [Falsiroseomonas bella]
MATDDALPVTLLFTDVEGSTRLLRSLGDESYRLLLAELSATLRAHFAEHGGVVVDSQGDGFFIAFERSPMDAVAAALTCQRSLAGKAWTGGCAPRLRMGIHTGLVRRGVAALGGGYVGLEVHRTARLCAAGHGGQVLLSATMHAILQGHLPDGVGLRALGHHRLPDLPAPEPIFQLLAPGLAEDFPALRVDGPQMSRLPMPRTALLGRERELREVAALLAAPEPPLLTLTGTGGAGKTRLGIAAAALASGGFRDGVCFVPLAPVTDPALLTSTLVRHLGLQEAGPTPLEDLLLGHLRDRELLLVLDNFEHLLEAAPLVGALLAGCPSVKVLATSRATLHLHGEHDYPVPALAVPGEGTPISAETAGGYAAVALFVERAAAVSRFALDASNAPSVAALCARLDGLPLAIELAAARTSTMTPAEMLQRLGTAEQHRTLDLLMDGPRDAPPRHRTLRSAIGWSFGLLDPTLQATFRRLSVCVGGFTLKAAAAVAGLATADGSAMAEPSPAMLHSLAGLAGNSLLQRIERPGGEARFAMLETIREFGLDQLDAAGEDRPARMAHALHFAALAEAGAQQVGGPKQAEWLCRLDEEQPNFRAALGWALSDDCPDPLLAARLATALWVFWFRRAHLREGSRWIEVVRHAGRASMSPRVHATLLTAEGSFARMIGDFARAESRLDEAVPLWQAMEDEEGLAWALSHLGLVRQWLGHVDEGVAILERSLALRRAGGDQRGVARSLFHLAIAEDFRGDFERAARLYEETLQVQGAIGDTWGSGRVLGYLAKALLRTGDHRRAEQAAQQALDRSTSVADRWGVGLAESALGGAAWARGEHARAAALLKRSLSTFRDVGARDRVAEELQDLALLAARHGAPEQSVRLSAAVAALQRTGRHALWPALRAQRDAALASLRGTLGEAAFEAAWARGERTELDLAVSDALTVPERPVRAARRPAARARVSAGLHG